jgi:imidazolonepropionase-like amidohydrolase
MRQLFFLIGLLLPIFSFSQTEKANKPAVDTPVVLKNVRIVDGTGGSIQHDQTLIISNGKIAAIGASSRVPVPAGAKVIDLSGHTVFPGLVMMHEHFEYREGSDFSHAQPVSYPRLFLAFGVTTVRTAGTDHPYVNINLKKAIDEGRVPGPEIFLTSPYLNGDGEKFHRNTFLGDAKVRTPEDAIRVVRYWAAEGMTSFKAYSGISKAALAAMIQEVHRLKLTITAHLGSVSCSEAADLGIDNIEHGFLCGTELKDSTGKQIDGADNPIVQALIKKLVNKKVSLTLTPNQRLNLFSDIELEVMHPYIREKYQKMKPDDPYLKTNPGFTRAKAFARAGGVLLLGSDAAGNGRIAGFTNIRGIKSMITGGFTLEETIKMASLNGATFLKIQNRTGSIAVGKEADLFIVKGDPSKKIEDIENVEMVFSNGILYDPKVLIGAVKGLVGWQ